MGRPGGTENLAGARRRRGGAVLAGARSRRGGGGARRGSPGGSGLAVHRRLRVRVAAARASPGLAGAGGHGLVGTRRWGTGLAGASAGLAGPRAGMAGAGAGLAGAAGDGGAVGVAVRTAGGRARCGCLQTREEDKKTSSFHVTQTSLEASDVNGRACNKKIQDHTGVTYATAFQEAGVEMVGHSALDLYNIREEEND
ncbi:uncharacterized protein LOC110431095 [Sorghum bicolor]|uniref:uncharacterized protein LOC110431095 n=1 Tax=Sorghum bicolor TaxID=4558 RepID=UPI000B4253F6|nr:uncharacterized protein LOC110431095 [Sorghum bicolor]|eukprot:XP_021305466.1 uncharacterized protein LOC110431095 [Sorghum bicolor]